MADSSAAGMGNDPTFPSPCQRPEIPVLFLPFLPLQATGMRDPGFSLEAACTQNLTVKYFIFFLNQFWISELPCYPSEQEPGR